MGKVGRNEPCPCGSGKKFKRCCGRVMNMIAGVAFKDVANIKVNPEAKKNFVISKTIVENQLRRDGPQIAESFDNLFGEHVREVSEEYARITSIFSVVMNENPEVF